MGCQLTTWKNRLHTSSPISDPATKDDAAALSVDIETIKRGHDAKIQAAKQALARWAAEAQERPGQGGTITLAMLELGIERHLEHFPDEKSATELVQGVLRKVLQQRRGPVQ
jgi:hypothetical protein